MSGVLALMFAADPTLTVDEALEILEQTATDKGAPGFDVEYGWGIVNAGAALEAVAARQGRISIADAQVSGIQDSYYTGSSVEPSPTVVLNGITLQRGVDYRVVYENNVEPGSMAQATIIGIGNYRGTIGISYRIMTHWQRLAGSGALDTMTAVVHEGYGQGSCSTVIVATIDGYWDALTASGLAGAYDCPVLFTDSNSLSPQTAAAITYLGAQKVFVMGGVVSISNTVKNQIAALNGVMDVERVSGDTASLTAVATYSKGRLVNAWGNTAVVVTVDGYWDALAASPFSYAKGAPIFLSNPSSGLDPQAVAAIRTGGFTKVLVCGGPSSVPNSVISQLSGIPCQRLFGASAHETSAVVAEYCMQDGMNCAHVGAASSSGYHDAILGAPLCGLKSSPLILVSNSNQSAIDSFVIPHHSEIDKGYIFGGTGSVSRETELALITATAA